MVTLRFRLSRLLVRIQSPHPFRIVACIFALLFVLSSPVFAEGTAEPDVSLEVEASESGIMPASIGGTNLYGLTWTVLENGLVTKVGAWNMTSLENQQLAGALYHVASQIQQTSISDVDFMSLYHIVEFYLSRIDASTDEVEGKLQNLYTELNQYHRPLLSSMSSYLSTMSSYLSNSIGTKFRLFSFGNAYQFSSLSEWLYYSNAELMAAISPDGGGDYLLGTGEVGVFHRGFSLAKFVANGFLGLSRNLIGADQSAAFSLLSPSEDGGMEASDQEVTNLLDALALLGTSLQNPLAKLQYVLADDDDIAMKQANKENENQFKENFTGDGEAAVKPSDIGELAGVSSSVKDTFGGAGSPADIFSVLNDSGSYLFFSQEVADELEPPVPSTYSDAPPFDVDALMEDDPEFWGQFDIDEEGFCTPKSSVFDVTSYLEGLK